MSIDSNTGLVLEGGGMRGIFTIGVLDAFMEHNITFPYAIGVSAGACHLCSYISRQPGRARFSNIDMMAKYKYISIKNLFLQGNIFDTKLLYDDLPNRIYPFDYDTFFSSLTDYEMVTTNCLTGKAEYMTDRESPDRIMSIILASSSLPYVARIVNVDGKPMLDGGIVDSIPIKRAIDKGFRKNVVVLTRNKGYRKSLNESHLKSFLSRMTGKVMYHKYPNLVDALNNRSEVYNRQIELIEDMEEKGEILVIRPENPIVVDRIERNVEKLVSLYEEGKKIGEQFIAAHPLDC